MRYDIFVHKTGVRVIEDRSGKHGTVVRIEETSYEWIEPIVKFDDEETPRRTRGELYLEKKEGQ